MTKLILHVDLVGYLRVNYKCLGMVSNLLVKSSVFSGGGHIPSKYTCEGEDVNPPLEVKNIPEGTKSLVLIVEDPDAPKKVWDHWLVWDIPPVSYIEEDTVPGTEGKNSFGKHHYGGPCPPSGTHRYFFKVYALNEEVDLPRDAVKEQLKEAMVGKILAKGELMGLYSRSKTQ